MRELETLIRRMPVLRRNFEQTQLLLKGLWAQLAALAEFIVLAHHANIKLHFWPAIRPALQRLAFGAWTAGLGQWHQRAATDADQVQHRGQGDHALPAR